MSKNRYLVTGATGFVGSNLVRKLVDKGYDTYIITRDKNLNWRIKDLKGKLKIFETDLLSPDLSQTIKKIKPTHIFHLAAYGALPKEDNIEKIIDINLKGTIRLIEEVKKYPFKIFVNTGSSSEYGIKNQKMNENDILKPINDYGVSKAASTIYCQKIAIRENLPIVTLRLFAVYGPYEDSARLVPYTILNALKNETLVFSSDKNVRDFIHVSDVVNAYLNAYAMPFGIYNIGSGEQHTIKKVCDIILKLAGSTSKANWNGVEKQSRQIEPTTWQADIAKVKKMSKWQPELSLEKGLSLTIEWFKKNKLLYEKH